MNLPAFFAGARPLFGGELSQRQVDALNAILKAWDTYGDDDPRHLAYILATAKHETMNFEHMREIWGPTPAQKGYEGRKDLGNTVKGDGKRFMGRGFVQITGRRNYADWSKRIGLDLLSKPSLTEEFGNAARIIVEGMLKGTFTGKKLADYPHDFVESRRIVNGMDRAVMISGYAYGFLKAIVEAQGVPKPAPAPTPAPQPQTPASEAAKPRNTRGIVGWIILAAVGIASGAAALWQHIANFFGGLF